MYMTERKQLEDYEYQELIDKLAGEALMAIGRGSSINTIVGQIAHAVNFWTVKVVMEKKGVGKKRKKP